jgi:2',3'-cyclic-nucleotide 2'-phosphodiesterase (5'-nucleotidase family)
VGVCDLVVDPVANRVVDSRFDLVRTWADEVVPDSAMAARMERWNAGVASLAAQKVGTNQRLLRRNRGGESTVGDVVADAMRAASGVDVALQNSGGLRADLEEGDITRGAIYEVMPFDNLVFTLGLTGQELKLALEQALKYNRVTQVSGIRYSYDSSRPAMDRVLTLTDAHGTPLDSARVYRVAVNDFMATGGDNYDVLSGGRDRQNSSILVREALEQYIADRCAKGALDVSADGRIQRVGGRGDAGD